MNEEDILDTYIQLYFKKDSLNLPAKALKKLAQRDYIDVIAKYLHIGKKIVRECLIKHRLYFEGFKRGSKVLMYPSYRQPSLELRVLRLESFVMTQASVIEKLSIQLSQMHQ